MIMQQSNLFDEIKPLSGHKIGVDEVGRGPLIGDVVAAAVILPADCSLPLMDSKKLSESKRDQLAVEIKQQALAYAVCSASPAEIDELNILHATMMAMRRAVNEVACQINNIGIVLVDGNRCPGVEYPCEAIVKGDAKVPEISAASILAKVFRDQQMKELDKLYPEYGFAQHKGYPTVSHLAAIEQFGLIEGYRKSFKPIKKLLDL